MTEKRQFEIDEGNDGEIMEENEKPKEDDAITKALKTVQISTPTFEVFINTDLLMNSELPTVNCFSNHIHEFLQHVERYKCGLVHYDKRGFFVAMAPFCTVVYSVNSLPHKDILVRKGLAPGMLDDGKTKKEEKGKKFQ